jgi:glycerol-3-phosphate cytidylyltransferase-like family protein
MVCTRPAKQHCGRLIVGPNSGDEVRACKGADPVFSDAERAAMCRACRWADEVIPATPYTPTLDLLDEIGADAAVHSEDFTLLPDGTDVYAEMKAARRIFVTRRSKGVSSELIICVFRSAQNDRRTELRACCILQILPVTRTQSLSTSLSVKPRS